MAEVSELRSFLRESVGCADSEVDLVLARCGGVPLITLNRLDGVNTLVDLGAIGLAPPWLDPIRLRKRLARVKHGTEKRACFVKFLHYLPWIRKHKLSWKRLHDLSLLEWEIAEEGNPWIMIPVLLGGKGALESAAELVGACYDFARSSLSPEKLMDDELAEKMCTGALYSWVRHHLAQRSSQAELSEEAILKTFRKTKLFGTLDWDATALREFDPAMGRASEHLLFNDDLGDIDTLEPLSEVQARVGRKVTQTEHNSLLRLANELLVDEEKRTFALRSTMSACMQLFGLLDAVQGGTLSKREREQTEKSIKQVVIVDGAAVRREREERRTMLGRACGLSLADVSDGEDDPE